MCPNRPPVLFVPRSWETAVLVSSPSKLPQSGAELSSVSPSTPCLPTSPTPSSLRADVDVLSWFPGARGPGPDFDVGTAKGTSSHVPNSSS